MSDVQPAAGRSGTVAKKPQRLRSVRALIVPFASAFLKITSAKPPAWHCTITRTTWTFDGSLSSRPVNSFTDIESSRHIVKLVLRGELGVPPPPPPPPGPRRPPVGAPPP